MFSNRKARRKQQEPPPTGGYGLFHTRRRKPVDPPSSSQMEAPELANKGDTKLEPSEQQPLVRQRNLFAGVASGDDNENRNQTQKNANTNTSNSNTVEPPKQGAQAFAKLPQTHEQIQDAYHHVTDDENESESPGDGEEVDENVNVSAREQTKGTATATEKKKHQQQTTNLGGSSNLTRMAMSRGGRHRPFSTRSNRNGAKGPSSVLAPKGPQQVQQRQEQQNPNKDLVSKNLVIATQSSDQETKPVHRKNRSLFAQQRRTTPKSSDNETVASMSSEKESTVTFATTTSNSKGISGNASVASATSSVAPSLSTLTNGSNGVHINTSGEKSNLTTSGPLSTTSSKTSSSTAHSHHAKANSRNGLREKLLGGAAGTTSSTEESKPSDVPTSPSKKISKVKPDPPPIAPATTTSSSGFDEKDYVRSLMMKQQPRANKRTSTSSSTSLKPKSSNMAAYVDKLLHKPSGGRDENQAGSSEAPSSKLANLSTAKSDTSSSTFSDSVAHKLMSKAKKRLSPKGKGANSPRSDGSRSRLEDAAKTLAGNMLSGYSKSPKNGRTGFKLGVPTRSQTRFSKKGSHSRPKVNYDHNLAISSSIDSAEPVKEASSFQSISHAASLSSTDADDDKTRTTLASSSTLSDDTKRSHGSSLKQLSTAETMDTDTSSTIMGNLHSASSDSMQYSSEEGGEEISVMHKHALKAIDRVPSGALAAYNNKTTATHPSVIPTSKRRQSENIGYNKFMKALQLEASLAHSQLWSSFQSVMTGDARRIPLQNDAGGQYRFDPTTRQMLGHMNLHLKRQAMVECAPATQLVNDKKLAKEAALLGLRAPENSAKGAPTLKQPVPLRQNGSSGRDRVAIVGKRATQHPNGISTVTERPGLRDTQSLAASLSHSMDDDDVSTASNRQQVPQDPHASKSELSTEGKDRVHASTETMNEAVKFISDPASTAGVVKPKQIRTSTGSKHAIYPQVPSIPRNENGRPEWEDVRLRSVSNKGTVTAEAAGQHTTMPSPWLKVKLRRVPEDEAETTKALSPKEEQLNMEENDALIETDGCTLIDRESWVSPTKRTPTGASSSSRHEENMSKMDEAVPQNDAKESSNGQKRNAPKLSSLIIPEDKPFSPAESSGTREKIDESAVVFELKRTPGAKESERETVVIGKKMVMMLQGKVDQSKANVKWSIPRDRVKALKLDMESQCVNLSFVDGDESKVLSFMDSTDCLKFANAFYKMLKPSEQRSNHPMPSTDETEEDDFQIVQKLSNEEQKVLETYRQVRRTKAPDDAIRAVVPAVGLSLGGTSEAARTAGEAREERGGAKDATESSKNDSASQPSLLSEEEMKIAKSYQKMLKLRIPPEAVQHKMEKESVDPKIVGFVLGQAGVLASDTNSADGDLSDSEQKMATLYKNMLKMMVPPEQVRNKMLEDNVDEKVVFAVLGKDKIDKKSLENTASKLSEAEEAIAASYRKMLKMMIPKEAVRHKMMQDQVDPKIMIVVVGGDGAPEKKEALTQEEEAIAATYRKMLKLQMPREAVKHRMGKDGVSEKIIKAVLGDDEGSKGAATPKPGASKGTQRGSKLVSLHWTPLSGKELDNSVWQKRKPVAAHPEGSDINKLVELFQKKSTANVAKGKAKDNSDNGTGKAKLLDLNRANIIAISLKAFKDFKHDELAAIIQNLDPAHKLKGERVQFVRDLLPTAAEVGIMKRYFGSPDRLVPAEQWFQKIAHIKRLEAKAHVLHTMEVFESEVSELQKSLNMLSRVCKQVMESERLRELLDMVLQIGNIMNEGTRTGGASGFKFDSLLRLTQTKSGDGKTTVLDYMVTIYAAKEQMQTLNLMEDFPDCPVASRMLISDLVSSVKDNQDKLKKCKQEYESLSSESAAGKLGPSSVTQKAPVVKSGASSDTQQQLFSAITSRGVADPRETASEAPDRAGPIGQMKKGGLLDAIKARGTTSSDDTPAVGDILKAVNNVQSSDSEASKKSPRLSLMASQQGRQSLSASQKGRRDSGAYGLQAGLARLNGFLEKADKISNALKSDCDTTVATCREMSKYCGESGGERATDALLGILSEFASSLDAAVKKHERVMKAEAKKQNPRGADPKKQRRRPEEVHHGSPSSRKTKSSPSKARPSPERMNTTKESKNRASRQRKSGNSVPQGKGTSLVLMVNELLKEATEETKKDFTQGVVYENPDDKLKAIYEREKREGMPPLPKGRRSVDSDLMSSLKIRSEGNKAKRSQLERVIDCISAAAADAVDDSDTTEIASVSSYSDDKTDEVKNKFESLRSKWDYIKEPGDEASVSSFKTDDGSVQNPIDCTQEEDDL